MYDIMKICGNKQFVTIQLAMQLMLIANRVIYGTCTDNCYMYVVEAIIEPQHLMETKIPL